MGDWKYGSDDDNNWNNYNSYADTRIFRKSSQSGGGGGVALGPIFGLVFCLSVIITLVKVAAAFITNPHAQPYQFVADFYRVILGAAGQVATWFVHLKPSPYGNLNIVILLGIAVAVGVGIYFALRAASQRWDVKLSRMLSIAAWLFAAPAIFGLSWWAVVSLFHWMFAKAA